MGRYETASTEMLSGKRKVNSTKMNDPPRATGKNNMADKTSQHFFIKKENEI